MTVVFPAPLRPGDRIGITSPSSGVPQHLWPRFEHAVQSLRDRGYDVVIGECMDGEGTVSAPKRERVAELMGMLVDPDIRAVVPPWGGVTAEVIACVAAEGFHLLDAAPQRINARDTPIPYHPNLWTEHRPNAKSIAAKARQILAE